MRTRCRICGLLVTELATQTRTCFMCASAYQRFRHDPRWGTKTVGGFQKVRGKLRFDGPPREVPNVPSGTWFRYIVRERLLRGLCRYPYTKQHARSHDTQWHPDKMPPWDDVHTIPWDFNTIDPQHLIGLELVDVSHEEPDDRIGNIGSWGPPAEGL